MCDVRLCAACSQGLAPITIGIASSLCSLITHADAANGVLMFLQESDSTAVNVANTRTPNKMNVAKFRGVVNRPIASSVVRAQEEFKLFVSSPDEIDHNLYGRFLGVLKGALQHLSLLGNIQVFCDWLACPAHFS